MHELAIIQSILEIVQRKSMECGAQRVSGIQLALGDWSGLVDDSIQFYFDMLSEGTIAQGAMLSFRRIPPRFHCRSCGTDFAPLEYDWRCPGCQSLGGDLVAGREFLVESIEIV